MANSQFDREILNVRERPLSSDINLETSYIEMALREFAMRFFQGRSTTVGGTSVSGFPVDRPENPVSSFFGDGFKVRANGVAGQVILSTGLGFQNKPSGTVANGDAAIINAIGGVLGLNDIHPFKPLILPDLGAGVGATITGIPVGDPVNPRIDIVEVLCDRRRIDASSRDTFNTVTKVFDPSNVLKTLTWVPTVGVPSAGASSAGIGYKTGVPAGVPATPATTAGYLKIAEIFVPALAATIVDFGGVGSLAGIRDTRFFLSPNGIANVSCKVALSVGPVATVSDVIAPPGVVVGAYALSIFSYILIISYGDTSTASNRAVTTAGTTQSGTVAVGNPSFVGLSAGDHAALLGANANPAVGITVGQPIILLTVTASATTTTNVSVNIRSGL